MRTSCGDDGVLCISDIVSGESSIGKVEDRLKQGYSWVLRALPEAPW